MKTPKKAKRTPKPITTGQINKAIDVFVHPLFKKDEKYIWLDELLHAIAERDPQVSLEKFAKYNLPELMKRKRTKKHTDRKRAKSFHGGDSCANS
jgi:hypothetical protein